METMVAACLCALILASLATAASVIMGTVRAQRETVACNLLLQERLEQLRAGGWSQITDGPTLRDRVLASPSTQEPLLGALRQRITVTTYPPVTPAAQPLQVEKLETAAPQITSQPPSGFSLRNRLSVRVDIRVEWVSGQNRRPRLRETSSVICLGGLLR